MLLGTPPEGWARGRPVFRSSARLPTSQNRAVPIHPTASVGRLTAATPSAQSSARRGGRLSIARRVIVVAYPLTKSNLGFAPSSFLRICRARTCRWSTPRQSFRHSGARAQDDAKFYNALMRHYRTPRVDQKLIRALLTFAVVLSLSGCGSSYGRFLGTYRGVLHQQGKENATVILVLSYGWEGSRDLAEVSVFSRTRSGTYLGRWRPRATNAIEASFDRIPDRHIRRVREFRITVVQKENERLVVTGTRYAEEIPASRDLDPLWFLPLDGLVLVKQ